MLNKVLYATGDTGEYNDIIEIRLHEKHVSVNL